MKRVTGIGGIFFKTKDPEAMKTWYREHLGIVPEADGHVLFKWRDQDAPEQMGYTAWAPFRNDTDYFAPSTAPFMINYRVDDLHALLDQLRQEGVEVIDKVEEYEFGRFGWIVAPEGNKIELWEPL